MPHFPVCRFILENVPQSGAWNMAVDEALLESAVAGGIPTVRWYRWRRPTVSLGYFQPASAADAWSGKPGIDVVRRLTGGGAILHHREWTYSCTLPALAPLLRHPYDLYDVVHRALCEALQTRFAVAASQRGVTQRHGDEPVMCYLRRDEHDVCCRGVKVIGSAQRRRRGALLQHGSVLLSESPYAPGIQGLCDVAPELAGACDDLAIDAGFARDLAVAIGAELQPDDLSSAERARAATLVRDRYARLQ